MNPINRFGCVYVLIDPLTHGIRYVGITKRLLKVRLYEHIHDSIYRDFPVSRWIRKLQNQKINPKIFKVAYAEDLDSLLAKEIYYISFYRNILGKKLLNCSAGGVGCLNPTEETRHKMSASSTGTKNPMWGKSHTEQTKEKIRNKATGRLPTTETRVKISLANKGKTRDENTVKNLSESKKGNKNPNYGKVYTKEERKKLGMRGDKHPRRKLSSTHVVKIRKTYNEGTRTISELANDYNVSYQTIYKIVNNTLWTSV